MGSIGSPGITNLAQILAICGPPAGLAAATASAAAPGGVTGDSVQLSDQALQFLDSPSLFTAGFGASSAGLVTSFQPPSLSSFTAAASANSFPPSLDSLISSLDTPNSSLNSSLLTPASSLSSSPLDSWTTWNSSQQTGSSSSSNSSSSTDQQSNPASLLAQDMQALFGGGSPASAGSSVNLLA